MKKISLLLFALMCATIAWANQYVGPLTVAINDYVGTQEGVTVTMEKNENGNYNLFLRNFLLEQEETTVGVGHIVVEDIPATINEDGSYSLSFDSSIQIAEGDESVDVPFWLGPTLGDVPVVLTGRFTDKQLTVHIDIDMMNTLEQIIKVDFEGQSEGGESVRGDLSGDGQVDVTDVSICIDMVLGKKTPDLTIADLDGNGMVDVSDVSAIIDIVLGK